MDTTPRELSYAQAIQEAMAIAMEADERVFLMGEDIGVYGGAFQVTGDLVERFGTDRVMDTPISELGGAGVAVGAAVTGMRPIFEFQFSDFATLGMEQIVNQAAKMRYMLGGEVSVPVVMRFPAGSGTGAAAQHSQSLEAWLGHVPGLKVIQPATPYDAKGMLLAAILSAFIAFYVGRSHAAQGGELPEDRLDANIDDGDPELGHFSPWSWWPVSLAFGAGLVILGLAVGFWSGQDEFASKWQAERTFEPTWPQSVREARMRRWRQAVELSKGWSNTAK